MKEAKVKGVDYVISPLSLPAITESLVRKHVEAGGKLFKVIEEPVFVDENVGRELSESIFAMRDLGASTAQSVLVVILPDGRSPRYTEVQDVWHGAGGVTYVINENDLDSFLKAQIEAVPTTTKEAMFVWMIPGGFEEFDQSAAEFLDPIGVMQILVSKNKTAREFLGIDERYYVNDFSILGRKGIDDTTTD
jgi:hypothetical protein